MEERYLVLNCVYWGIYLCLGSPTSCPCDRVWMQVVHLKGECRKGMTQGRMPIKDRSVGL